MPYIILSVRGTHLWCGPGFRPIEQLFMLGRPPPQWERRQDAERAARAIATSLGCRCQVARYDLAKR